MNVLISHPCLYIAPKTLNTSVELEDSLIEVMYGDEQIKQRLIGHHVLKGTLHSNGNVISLTAGYRLSEDGIISAILLRSNGCLDTKANEIPELAIEIRDKTKLYGDIEPWCLSMVATSLGDYIRKSET